MKIAMSLEEQITRLHSELEAAIDAYVDECAAQVPGVPRGSVEGSLLHRARGCRCEEYKIIQAKLEAERKLADAQTLSTG
jgi:hypothetical protein